MKRTKLFMPLAVALTATTPITMLTGCSESQCTITLNAGEHGTVSQTSITVNKGKKWSEVKSDIPTPVCKDDYTFKEWTLNDSSISDTYVIEGNITLVAKYTSKDITVDKKEIKSGDSYTSYKFTLPTVPSDKKVSVEIVNASASQEQVILDPDEVLTTNGSNYAAELTVADDGTVEVPVCYAYAPTESSTSGFGVTFKYNNNEVTKTVNDLKFDYNVDYDVDLKDGSYDPTKVIAPAEAEHWVDPKLTVADIYMNDIESNSGIFQSDARYSTSLKIKDALTNNDFENLKSFRAYFNNVYKDDKGLNVQMNYEVKGEDSGSKFTFIQYGQGEEGQGQRRFTFTNFDLSCNFMTENGYTFAWDSANKTFTLKDPTTSYDLYGRMKGKFDVKVESRDSGEGSWTTIHTKTGINYDGLISLDESNETYTDQFVAFMFAFGVIHLTYGFGWGVEPKDIVLKIASNYAKNA